MHRPMSAQTRNEKEMSEVASKEIRNAKSPIDKLRWCCLKRGTRGIMKIAKMFKMADDDKSGLLSFEEFKEIIDNYGIGSQLKQAEMEELFNEFDCDESGSIDYDSFLLALRPPMSKARLEIIEKAFGKLDRSGDGIVTVEDISGVYNVTGHPQYQNGEKTAKQLLKEYLAKFEEHGDVDGKVTKEEFTQYYAGVSASIDSDAYFDLMMRQAWKLK
ncbi:Uncharacterised protein g1932 [Pycnogonum litorale]